jgi:hypothetical protein
MDDLGAVMLDHGPLLQHVEKQLDDWGINHPHLYSRYLEPANKANPPVIHTYAEEVLAAANVYQDLTQALSQDNDALSYGWTGHAATTAVAHGGMLHQYLSYCHDEAAWLGQTGNGCATILAKLRSGYAAVVRDHIQAINTAYNEATSWLASFVVMWDPFTDTKDIAKDLVDNLTKAEDGLIDVLNKQQQIAKDLIAGEITAGDMPDLATNAHAHHSPVSDNSPLSNAWADPGSWGN